MATGQLTNTTNGTIFIDNISYAPGVPVLVDNLTPGQERAIALGQFTFTQYSTAQDATSGSKGFQSIAVGTSAAGFASIPTGASRVLIAPVAAVFWRDDGVAPTAAATGGMPLSAQGTSNSYFTYSGNLAKLQFIAATATTMSVTFY